MIRYQSAYVLQKANTFESVILFSSSKSIGKELIIIMSLNFHSPDRSFFNWHRDHIAISLIFTLECGFAHFTYDDPLGTCGLFLFKHILHVSSCYFFIIWSIFKLIFNFSSMFTLTLFTSKCLLINILK